MSAPYRWDTMSRMCGYIERPRVPLDAAPKPTSVATDQGILQLKQNRADYYKQKINAKGKVHM